MRPVFALRRPVLCLSMLAGMGVWAHAPSVQAQSSQAPSQPGQAQSQPLSQGSPPKAPAAAPRTPVQQGAKPAPVVQPHGSAHPQKQPPHVARELPLPVPPLEPEAGPPPQAEAPATDEKKPLKTKGPIPRFAALRFDDVNMRHGPGPRYPIDWVYKRRDLPVQIEREFDIWRLVRDAEGTRGWVSEASLTGRRTFIITGAEASLRGDANDTAAVVAVLKQGVIGRIRSCEAGSDWCRVQSGDYRGYIKRSQFWGTLPGEAIAP